MYDPAVVEVLGLAADVWAERWTDPEGPGPEEIRVLQRCLCLLGYPTGDGGQPDIDGEFGPNLRRALKQFQEEADLPPTGSLDEISRAKLYGAAAAFLTALPADQRSHVRGQLDRVQNLPRPTYAWAIRYYLGEAEKRVPENLRAALLAVLGWANMGVALPGLDLPAYLANLQTMPLRAARLAASRYGFLQLPADWFAARPHLPVDRAANPGDLGFHFDAAAEVFLTDSAVRAAAEANDGERLAQSMPWLEAACVIPAPFGLSELLAQVQTALART